MPNINTSTQSLTHVLDQSEHIKDVVEECAEELSSINTSLKQELSDRPTPPRVKHALYKSETVENKVQDCAEELSTVNQALENEVAEREILEDQLNVAKQNEEKARHAAFHDPLTSLPNRVLFNDRLEHGIAQAKRHNRILAVMFIDLDKFKSINDTFGHAAGDEVLIETAVRLNQLTREDDTVCRQGGDEFLYLLLEIRNETDTVTIAEKIMRTLSKPHQIQADSIVIKPRVLPSIGIAIFPKDGDSSDALINSADRAMYQAKRNSTGYAFLHERHHLK
jgi:diguanylate cyclase (GGDEF)-like protein